MNLGSIHLGQADLFQMSSVSLAFEARDYIIVVKRPDSRTRQPDSKLWDFFLLR